MDESGLARCAYSIAQHSIICISQHGSVIWNQGIHSGLNECRNNPACVDDKNDGPVQPDTYHVSADTLPGQQGWWALQSTSWRPNNETTSFEYWPTAASTSTIRLMMAAVAGRGRMGAARMSASRKLQTSTRIRATIALPVGRTATPMRALLRAHVTWRALRECGLLAGQILLPHSESHCVIGHPGIYRHENPASDCCQQFALRLCFLRASELGGGN
jgi:hypothetical protein